MNVAYIFPPPWDPTFPPYAMTLFEGSTKRHHHVFFGFDLNVDLYHAVSEEDKELWKDRYAVRWNTEWERITKQYSSFFDAYITRILNMGIRLYAFYTSAHSKHLAFFIAKKIKETDHMSAIILGGPHCFPAYDHLAILENEFVDAICTGEGDSVWPAILDGVSKQGDLHIAIPGLAYKADDGTIVNGGVPGLVDDLDTIPFADYSSIDFAKYGNGYKLSTMTSRGCINTCAFCSERPNFHKYRHRSAENILEEIVTHVAALQQGTAGRIHGEHERVNLVRKKLDSLRKEVLSILRISRELSWLEVLRRGHDRISRLARRLIIGSNEGPIPHINFNDSLINGAPRELDKFCDMVIERGIKFTWGGMALLRKEMTGDLLVKMKKAGCRNLSWGLESGCQEVLTLMHKRFFSMDLAKEIIKETYRVGIWQSAALIVGFPGETDEMFQETVQFVRDYEKYFGIISAQTMMIVHNSRVYDRYEEFGLDYENAQNFLQWQTIDGSNNYQTRLRRLEILNAVLKDKMLRIDK